jgi:hypothetical protein
MSMKEISALAMVLGSAGISVWIAINLASNGPAPDMAGAAWEMLWAMGYVIVFNIVISIAAAIIASIVIREGIRDERADERDKHIGNRAMAVGYFVLSLGVLGTLFWQAFGLAPNLVPYVLFGISMLTGIVYASSQLVLYRVN